MKNKIERNSKNYKIRTKIVLEVETELEDTEIPTLNMVRNYLRDDIEELAGYEVLNIEAKEFSVKEI